MAQNGKALQRMQEKINLLLVDDKPENLLVLESLLEDFNLNLLKATSGAEALKLSVRHDFALILLDVQMPDMDGFETAEILRSVEKTKGIPIIFVTAISKAPEHVFKGYESGAVDYLFKPIEPYILKSKVRIFVEMFRQKYQLARQASELEEANRQLTEVNHRMRKFVGIVAHDLRAPLGKLINISEVLLSGVEPDTVHTFYKLLVQTSRRGFDLVNDILDLTAMENGQIQLEMDRLDFTELVQQVITELEYLAAEKQITIVNEITGSNLVRADSKRIFQVLGNLLTNAVKFTPTAGRITFKSEALEDGFLIKMEDTGVGMPRATLDKLFNKHEKVSTVGTEGERGTGLGLLLCQELLQAHGSKIEVTSELNKGSCFMFQLPWWRDDRV